MSMENQLFTGKLVRLGALDPERDADAFARWSQDSEYLRLIDMPPPVPRLAKSFKEDLTAWQAQENDYIFVIRTLDGDRAIGFIELDGISWTNREAWIGIGIGEREFWGKGYGTDAMQVLTRYAFTELQLRRLSLNVYEYNVRAQRSYQKAGFVVEGHARQVLNRDGQRWDLVYMGLLKEEWEKQHYESKT